MPTKYVIHKIVFAFLNCWYIGMASYACTAAAAEHKSIVYQSPTKCPCVTCEQRWSIQQWWCPEHPYTNAERKVAIIAGPLACVQQKDQNSGHVSLPLVDLVIDYYRGHEWQQWVSMPALRAWLYPLDNQNYIRMVDDHNNVFEVPLVTADTKFAENDIKAINAVISKTEKYARAICLSKQYKIDASITHSDDTIINRWYCLPTKQRILALIKQQQYQAAHPWLSYFSGIGHK